MSAAREGIAAIEAVVRTVPDLDAAERFYRDALGCVAEGPRVEVPADEVALLGAERCRAARLALRLGRQRLAFLRFEPEGRSYPADSTASDLWFQHCAVVVGDMVEAHARVMAAGARPITRGGPQHLPANTGGVTAFKFRDPFGHPLELLHFPEGVGDPAWQGAGGGVFRGIDHTAIAVSPGPASGGFYTEVLGLSVTERSRNRGPAQTRLDAVPDNEVDVVALAPRHAPPHLELLAYRTGTRRRLRPAGATDLAVSRTLARGDVAAVAARLTRAGVAAADLTHGRWDGRQAVAFRDPDGHEWICAAAP